MIGEYICIYNKKKNEKFKMRGFITLVYSSFLHQSIDDATLIKGPFQQYYDHKNEPDVTYSI